MGSWICHLRVAEAIYQQLPHLNETAFILGSLSPDSGIPNADWTVFDPPKEVTHFIKRSEGEEHIRDLEYYRGCLAPLPADDSPRYSFRLAYFFHLLCDSLFVRRVWHPTKALLGAEIDAQGWLAVINRVKEDWYGLDHLYVQAHPQCAYWRVLMTADNPPAYLDFIPAHALGLQLDYIRDYYSKPDPELNLERPFIYLNEAHMACFVRDCADACLKIYARLQTETPPEQMLTALDLMDKDELAGYEPPLGDVPG